MNEIMINTLVIFTIYIIAALCACLVDRRRFSFVSLSVGWAGGVVSIVLLTVCFN